MGKGGPSSLGHWGGLQGSPSSAHLPPKNSPHPDGARTPLHCAASCNDTGVCVALVRHGAAIFATTTSDGSLAVEKCDPYREGYADCYNYLTGTRARRGTGGTGSIWGHDGGMGTGRGCWAGMVIGGLWVLGGDSGVVWVLGRTGHVWVLRGWY